MQSQVEKNRPGLRYIHMDALQMDFVDEQFSVVLDKGTLDALMPDEGVETDEKIERYFGEILRVLRVGGRYVCVSLLQRHILKKLLAYFPSHNCMFRAVRCFEPEQKSAENGENAMPVFLVVCSKFKTLPRHILEVNLGDAQRSLTKLESASKVIDQITDVQRASFLCSRLKNTSLAVEEEISFELHQPGCDETRYTIYVVDIPWQPKNASYAAFIAPVGREAEWLFSTKTGRKQLATATNHNRLAVVTTHRGQEYTSLEGVQVELAEVIRNLAPSTFKGRTIPFLSLGSDVGKREIKYRNSSKCSGDYVIEDVVTETGDQYRRLYYLNNQLVIQSEAKLKQVKNRKGKPAQVVDLCRLTCRHHVYMSVAAYAACHAQPNPKIAVLGLGGGGLCSFLRKFLPRASIAGVEIDDDMVKIASRWFGFAQDDKLRAHVRDALEYIRELSETKVRLDAILCDVDCKDASVGMSCPPAEFLVPRVLKMAAEIVSDGGLFIINVVLRDLTLRPGILRSLKACFANTAAYKLDEDLNEIFVCFNGDVDEEFTGKLKQGCEELRKFFIRNKVEECDVDIAEYLNNLRINV
ncbi:eEF1A lysine and N-terminal methyltransferase homolog isoform X2 [Cylas formicarius]|nr:eEF1A lysine and N-terminal methyltransferase homolog isoform X2 [Cylas formicarius]